MKPIYQDDCAECEGSGHVECRESYFTSKGTWMGTVTCPTCHGSCLMFKCGRCCGEHWTEDDADDCCRNGNGKIRP